MRRALQYLATVRCEPTEAMRTIANMRLRALKALGQNPAESLAKDEYVASPGSVDRVLEG